MLQYACVVWSPHRQQEINLSESIPRKPACFIFHLYDCDFSTSTALESLNLTPLSRHQDKGYWKALHCKLSLLPVKRLKFAKESSARCHCKLNIIPMFVHTNIFKFSFFPWTVELWNSLKAAVLIACCFASLCPDFATSNHILKGFILLYFNLAWLLHCFFILFMYNVSHSW